MSKTRTVDRITSSIYCLRPSFIPKPRLRGTKALGLTFERKLRKSLPSHAIHNQWFKYSDSTGTHWCCVDWMINFSKISIVIESKLTRIDDAKAQLLNLYLPVLSLAATPRTVVPIIAVKSLSRWNGTDKVFSNLKPAVEYYLSTKSIPIIHYLGVGKL